MKKLGKYGKKVSCVVIGMLCAAAIGACGSTQSGSQDEKDVRNDISVYEEGADLEGTLTFKSIKIVLFSIALRFTIKELSSPTV